jgi:hypothetical protein
VRLIRRGPGNCLAVCAVLLLGIAADFASAEARAQSAQSGENMVAPLPPSRPAPLDAPAAPSAPAAAPKPQDQQATENSSTPAWQPGKLLQLPPYTRPRMHECALEWEKMKASGAAAEKIWFTFAQSCLVR